MLANGDLQFAAVHGHDTIGNTNRSFKTLVEPNGIAANQVILNESGSYSNNWMDQAECVAGKAIWAKANGMRGFSAYYLGGVYVDQEAGINSDLSPENAQADYSLISQNLEPKPGYLAYMTVIRMLNNAAPYKVIREDTGSYCCQFVKNGNIIEVTVGTLGAPSVNNISYLQYDMYGTLTETPSRITYRIFDDTSQQ
jgi:hypothetical protein